MNERRVTINPEWRFSNGTYIFKGNGIQINPKSEEGNQIEYLIWLQKKRKMENEEQKKLVNKLRNAKNGEEAMKILKEHVILK